ncbi:MAG: hypothetical protein GEU86_20490 [Actinophytocola sp.]|nr:hypothetical protein [Actinophytocola sp.]
MSMSPLEKISNTRFDGFNAEMLAIEIDLFREGVGTGSLSAAVEALTAVASALAETDSTLREELGKLGVVWESTASGMAQGVIGDHADFAGDAKAKIDGAAQAAFAVGEAFNRTLHNLPDAQPLREGAGGLGTGDVLAGLIGHETDHAAKVKAASAARDQAIDAFNGFAKVCANELRSIQPLFEPATITLNDGAADAPHGSSSDHALHTMAAAASSVAAADRTPASDPMTMGRGAATPTGTTECPPPAAARQSSSGAADTAALSSRAEAASGTSGGSAPTTSGAGAVTGTGSPTGGGGTAASPGDTSGRQGGTSASAAGASVAGVVAGICGSSTGTRSSGSKQSASSASQGQPAGGGSSGGGAAKPGGPAVSDGRAGFAGTARPGGPGITGGPGQGAVGGGEALAKGRLLGAVPPTPQPTTPVGPGITPSPPAGGGAGFAGGAAAVGAAGVAGATSGEADREHRGRGYGEGTEVDGRPLHDFEIGELEDEQDAANVERVEPQAQPDEPAYLEQAAPQDGAPGEPRVRTHGVDDADLFADERLVSREVIGDDANAAYHSNDPEDPSS